MDEPRTDLYRAMPRAIELQAGEDGIGTLTGHFSVFDVWYEVNSAYEGHFLERIAPGAFADTIANDLSSMRVTFNHGQDPQLGDKVLGPISLLEEDGTGARYEVPLFDTSYNRDLLPGLKAGVYGSSFRFNVEEEGWERKPSRSDHNPEALPERTITRARVGEFGPVTYPANAAATAGVRSVTDRFRPAPAPAPPSVPAPARKESPVSEYITREEKAARVDDLRASISRRAVEYDGELPHDVKELDEAELKEHDALVRAIAAWDERQARVADLAKLPTTGIEIGSPAPVFQRKQTSDELHDLGKIKAETRSRDEFNTRVRENALRSIDGARFPRGAKADDLVDIIQYADEGDEGEGEISRRVLLTGAPAYRRAFNKYLRGERDLWSQEEARAAALAVTGTTTTGGYAVPYVFDPTIIRIGAYTAVNPYRQACRVETITNGNNWRTVTVGAVTTTYIAEAGAATEQGPTFGQPTYTVQSAHAFATVSHETMQDRPDIGEELGAVFAESKATYEENQFTLGAGSTVYPLGMFVDTAYTNQDTAGNDTTAIADTAVVEGALPLRFRANAAWFMNRSTIRQLQVLDTTYRYFSGAGIQFQGPGLANSTGPQLGSTTGGNTGLYLLGYPIWEVPSAPSTLTTDGAIIAVLCDPKTYIIVDRLGMSIEVIPNMLNGATPSFPTGQRGIYARFRNTAKPLTATGGISLSVQ